MNSLKISRVLVCRPTYFTVNYVINPHMQLNSVNKAKAMHQWLKLVNTLESLSIKVEVIEQQKSVPDMVFATDQGIVCNNKILVANFRYIERRGEQNYYRKWFTEHGFELVVLANKLTFEGGDAAFFDSKLLVGTGFRASAESCYEIARKLNVTTVPLELIDPFFYHLDMCLLVIDSRTAFYFPPAFSEDSVHLLKKLIPNLIKLTKEAAQSYASNSFVSGKDIIIATGTPISFQKTLINLGMHIYKLDISEFKKAGGGIHCLINALS